MPHTHTWNKKGLFREFSGKLEPEEILKSNIDIQNQPEFKTIKYIINDFTSVTEVSISEDHTKIYASTDDIISDDKGNLKIAIIAKLDSHIALANSYKEEMKNMYFKCEIFQSIEEAKDWVK